MSCYIVSPHHINAIASMLPGGVSMRATTSLLPRHHQEAPSGGVMEIGISRIGCGAYAPWLVLAIGSTRIGLRAQARNRRGQFVALATALAGAVTVEPVEYELYGSPVRRVAPMARAVLGLALCCLCACVRRTTGLAEALWAMAAAAWRWATEIAPYGRHGHAAA